MHCSDFVWCMKIIFMRNGSIKSHGCYNLCTIFSLSPSFAACTLLNFIFSFHEILSLHYFHIFQLTYETKEDSLLHTHICTAHLFDTQIFFIFLLKNTRSFIFLLCSCLFFCIKTSFSFNSSLLIPFS